MTREEALEFLLKQALRALNGVMLMEGVCIRARKLDDLPFEIWKARYRLEGAGQDARLIDCSTRLTGPMGSGFVVEKAVALLQEEGEKK